MPLSVDFSAIEVVGNKTALAISSSAAVLLSGSFKGGISGVSRKNESEKNLSHQRSHQRTKCECYKRVVITTNKLGNAMHLNPNK